VRHEVELSRRGFFRRWHAREEKEAGRIGRWRLETVGKKGGEDRRRQHSQDHRKHRGNDRSILRRLSTLGDRPIR
jgi:hypothetical protein